MKHLLFVVMCLVLATGAVAVTSTLEMDVEVPGGPGIYFYVDNIVTYPVYKPPPKPKCEDIGFVHSWSEDPYRNCVVLTKIPLETVCEPASRVCLNCGKKQIYREPSNGYWEDVK